MAKHGPNTWGAHKAINLSTVLANADKQVAGALIEHYNRKTGQCDPSLERLAMLIEMSPRSVIRAVDRLVKHRFFRRIRHGGKFHRNSYEPNWSRFDQVLEEWNARRKFSVAMRSAPDLSPCHGQVRQPGRDKDVNQTFNSNPSKETLLDKPSSILPADISRRDFNGSEIAESTGADRRASKQAEFGRPSNVAARDAAERRWNSELTSHLRHHPSIYGRIVEAIDVSLMDAVTVAELSDRGSGFEHLMNELLRRKVIDEWPLSRDEGPWGGRKVWRGRGRTGGLGTHFFTQNSRIIFFES